MEDRAMDFPSRSQLYIALRKPYNRAKKPPDRTVIMTTKELIQSEIDHVPVEDLDALYHLIRQFVKSKESPQKPGILSKLRSVSIDAPTDFAANLDLYMSGEKRVEDSIH
jgi:hypothetical protein